MQDIAKEQQQIAALMAMKNKDLNIEMQVNDDALKGEEAAQMEDLVREEPGEYEAPKRPDLNQILKGKPMRIIEDPGHPAMVQLADGNEYPILGSRRERRKQMNDIKRAIRKGRPIRFGK
jgi:hypothetical protein